MSPEGYHAFVTDWGAVNVFSTADGSLVDSLGKYHLDIPFSICFANATDELIVADKRMPGITVLLAFSRDGKNTRILLADRQIGTGNVYNMVVSTAGVVYVATDLHQIICIELKSGTFLKILQPHSSHSSLCGPYICLSTDETYLFIADSDNQRIVKMNVSTGHIQNVVPAGTSAIQRHEKGSDPGQFNKPTAVLVTNAGELYVADSGNSRIQVFGMDGTFRRQWGSRGSGKPYGGMEFHSPGSLAECKADGRIYVADFYCKRLTSFD